MDESADEGLHKLLPKVSQVVVRVEGYDTSLSKIDIQSGLSNLFSSYGTIEELIISQGHALAYVAGKDIADKAPEVNGSHMGGRKLAVQVLRKPGIYTTHPRRRYGRPPPVLPENFGSSTSDGAIPHSRSESTKTPDESVEKKRKLSEEQATTTLKSKAIPSSVEKQTPDLAGLVVDDICMGAGKKADPGKMVSVRYTAKLQENGKIFCSSKRNFPLKFRLGVGCVLPGFEFGVTGMCVGGKRKLTIPPALGFGAEGVGDKIPPDAWLVVEVELIKVK